ncbi:MAG: hypothetical protein LBJ32_04530 [Oscillospiraceae bacterium]|nr:hypothetical protein [Oscillospiraceae bacterium]
MISSYRIKVEHAICGIKRLRCLTDVFRGKKGIALFGLLAEFGICI